VFQFSIDHLQSLFALLLGFALAASLTTGYQALVDQPPSFRVLSEGPRPSTFAALGFLMFAAPFIIVRNVLRGQRIERAGLEFVFLATVIAGSWSLFSGTLFIDMLRATGLFG
jgi:hypothetical protein